MKKVILSVAIITALGLISCKDKAKQEQQKESSEASVERKAVSEDMAMAEISFGVRGNCGMCKETIEEAANGVEGVGMADWDKAQKKIDVKFDKSKTNVMAIHKAIAASGYDTEKVAADNEAYKNLPECCQYDHSMMMNQDAEMTKDGEHHHNH